MDKTQQHVEMMASTPFAILMSDKVALPILMSHSFMSVWEEYLPGHRG